MLFLDEGVLKFLYKNNKNGFDVYFLHFHSLEYLLEETLGGNSCVHQGYIKKLLV